MIDIPVIIMWVENGDVYNAYIYLRHGNIMIYRNDKRIVKNEHIPKQKILQFMKELRLKIDKKGEKRNALYKR